MDLIVLTKKYSICKFKNGLPLPEWIYLSDFYSITKTKDELSIVAEQREPVSGNIDCNKDWRIIKVVGPLDFSQVGIIAELSNILKEKKISIFTISTYDTDYILVKEKDLKAGIDALRENKHYVFLEK